MIECVLSMPEALGSISSIHTDPQKRIYVNVYLYKVQIFMLSSIKTNVLRLSMVNIDTSTSRYIVKGE
jgi:hypothetical protein